MDQSLRRPQSLAEQAAVAIRTRIIDGEFQLGSALSEVALAADLGVSKTPVREALLRLSKDGLVDIQPQRGTFVFQLDARQVGALTDMRELLELKALGVAAARPELLAAALKPVVGAMEAAIAGGDVKTYRRLDNAFHLAIIDQADNEFLADAYDRIAFRVQALRSRLSRHPSLNLRSLGEHRRFLDLVTAGDMDGAGALLAHHIRVNGDEYIEMLARS